MSLTVDVLPVTPLRMVRILVDLPAGISWKVTGFAGESQWLAGEGRSSGHEQSFADPWAPLGQPVVYELSSELAATHTSDPVVRTYRGQHVLTDLAGRTVVAFLWEKGSRDPWELEPRGEFLDVPGSGFPVGQYPATAGAGTGSVTARTIAPHSRTLLSLVQRNRLLLLLHNARACRLPECDVPPAQTIKLLAAPAELTSRMDRAERRWNLSYRHVPRPYRYLAPVATWGDLPERWETNADLLAEGMTNLELARGDWLVGW